MMNRHKEPKTRSVKLNLNCHANLKLNSICFHIEVEFIFKSVDFSKQFVN